MKDREYKRVMAFVKDGIRSGEFRVGSKLPTEREMAETLGMSRPSIREALKSMENIGLIASRAPAIISAATWKKAFQK